MAEVQTFALPESGGPTNIQLTSVQTYALPEPGVVTMEPLRPGSGLVPTPSNVGKGSASRTTDSATLSATNEAKELPSVLPNVLENFASHTALWTLASLTPMQFNDPLSYRNNPADLKDTIVFSSAGRYDSQRVNTYHGTPEYFIDNINIKTLTAGNPQTGNAWSTTFSFDIYEPYSMGILLEGLQTAAIKAGYASYVGSPFVLKCDFQGFDEDGTSITLIKSKFFPLYITSAKFKVTEAGSFYKVTAVPFGDIGHSGLYNTTFNDLKIKAGKEGTVAEILKTGEFSLAAVLNAKEERLLKEKMIGVKDVYDIQFPPDSSKFSTLAAGVKKQTTNTATVNPSGPSSTNSVNSKAKEAADNLMNDIGKSKFNFSQNRGGIVPMGRAGVAYDERAQVVNPAKITLDATTREFQFPQGISLIDVINQVILSSDYVKNVIDPKKKVDGMITYFMVDIQVELLEMDVLTHDYAKKITFRIVPYKVNSAIFSNPTTKPEGMDTIKKRICKAYNYMYTGKNTDILKFDIDIDNLFYIGLNPSPVQDTAKGAADPNQGSIVEQQNRAARLVLGENIQESTEMRKKLAADYKSLKERQAGGSGITSPEQMVAESFHKAFIDGSSADMVRLNLEILGDPYWLSDTGMGNHFATADADNPQKTSDNSTNYQDGEIYIYMRFRSPIDMREDMGIYQFSTDTNAKESDFSGIYKVTKCESVFSSGLFKQKLTCVRMLKQSVDSPDTKPDPNSTGVMTVDGNEPLPTEPNQTYEDSPDANTTTQFTPTDFSQWTKPPETQPSNTASLIEPGKVNYSLTSPNNLL